MEGGGKKKRKERRGGGGGRKGKTGRKERKGGKGWMEDQETTMSPSFAAKRGFTAVHATVQGKKDMWMGM
jgi:hypothetical protein